MRYRLLLAAFLIPGYGSFSQSNEIIIAGKVKEIATGKCIKARITYRSVPTGSISGSFYDSLFQFPVFGSSKYQVSVVAEHYIPKTILVDPKFFEGRTQITRDITLTPEGQAIRLEHLLFEQQKSSIAQESYSELDDIVALLRENTKMVIQLEGHTDNNGNAKANMDLSQARVDAVKKYIVGKGIEKSRVKTKAFGGTRPVSDEKTPEARNLNRRVEMRVLSEN